MKILLIRHGETDWNVQGRFQGREDIPLNATGIAQAKHCGLALKGERYEAVITSPLIRARRTAEIIAECIDTKYIIVDPDLIERDFSKVSGMTSEERKAFLASGQTYDPEPWEHVRCRMMASIRKHAKEFNGNIIMVSHGASIRGALDELTDNAFTSQKIILKNTCISIVEYEEGNLKLGPYNLTSDDYINSK